MGALVFKFLEIGIVSYHWAVFVFVDVKQEAKLAGIKLLASGDVT